VTDLNTRISGADTATHREISQQPRAWLRAAADLRDRRAELDRFLLPLLEDPMLRIVLVGAGTSAFVGEIVAPTLVRSGGFRVDAIATTDIVADPLGCLDPDSPTLFVSFARSGNSPESVAATRIADELIADVHHLVITCDPDGALAREHTGAASSLVIVTPPETNDTGFAMTSSFTTMLLSCLLVFLGDRDDTVERVVAAADVLLADEHRIAGLLDTPTTRVVYLGSGALTGLARESALKLLELTAGTTVSFFDSALGFRHGPKAVLNEETLVVVYQSGDAYTAQYDEDIITELRGVVPGRVVRIGSAPTGSPTETGSGAPTIDVVPSDLALTGLAGIEDGFRAVAFVVFAQLLALHASIRSGSTPDNPFPDGVVNRVVRGVTVHPLRP
jgi:tagatose-6-phosphate ketose/aldose isomerase